MAERAAAEVEKNSDAQERAARPRSRRARGGSEPAHLWLRISLYTLLAVVAVGAAWAADRFLTHDSRFRLQTIEVVGAEHLSRSEVEEVFRNDYGKSIWRLPLERRREELEQVPWIRHAIVNRVLPETVYVTVEERTPVAFLWTSEGISLLDAEGIILDAPPNFSPQAPLPVVRGIAEAEPLAQRAAKMRLFQTMMEELGQADRKYTEQISEVDLEDPQDVRVILTDAARAVELHLGKEDFLARFNVYVNQIGEWRQQFADIRSVDLRYAGQVIIHSGQPEQKPGPPKPAGKRAANVRPAVAVATLKDTAKPAQITAAPAASESLSRPGAVAPASGANSSEASALPRTADAVNARLRAAAGTTTRRTIVSTGAPAKNNARAE